MKLLVLSDLHLELSPWSVNPATAEAADVVVLAGDIHSHTHGLEWARQQFPEKTIVYVAGNHEAFGAHLQGLTAQLRKVAAELGIYFLENNAMVLGGVRFAGCTLWTDFQLFGAVNLGKALHAAGDGLNDFACIRYGSSKQFSPANSVTLHQASRNFLAAQLAAPFEGRTVVVSHHLPTGLAIAPKYANDILSAAFASNLDGLVEQADLWICGHTHVAADIQVGRCRVVVNPRGYDGERSGWNPDLLVDVEGQAN